jgi:uncharacterized protein YkwD
MNMIRMAFKLLAILLLVGGLAGGAYGVARHVSGEKGSPSDVEIAAPVVPVISAALAVVVTPTALPGPPAEPVPEAALVEEPAAAPENVDVDPLVAATDVSPSPPEPLPPPPPPPPPPPVDPAILAAGLVAGINAERVAAGLPPLQFDPDLAMVAAERSSDMVQKGYFGHVSPTGETSVTLMDRYDIPHSWSGENIAYNNYPDSQTVAAVLSGWMSSPGHRNNILSPQFNKVGVGVAVDGSGMKYYTAVFAES